MRDLRAHSSFGINTWLKHPGYINTEQALKLIKLELLAE